MLDDKEIALFQAIKEGDLEWLQQLIEETPDLIYAKTDEGNTLLHCLYAMDQEESSIADWLRHKAPELEEAVNKNNETPWDIHRKVQAIFSHSSYEVSSEVVGRYADILRAVNVTSARVVVNYLTRTTGQSPVDHNQVYAAAYHEMLDSLLTNQIGLNHYISALTEIAENSNDEDALVFFTIISYLNFRLKLQKEEKQLENILIHQHANNRYMDNNEKDFEYASKKIQENKIEDLFKKAYKAEVKKEDFSDFIQEHYLQHWDFFLEKEQDLRYWFDRYKRYKDNKKHFSQQIKEVNLKLQDFESVSQRLSEAREDFTHFIIKEMETRNEESKSFIMSTMLDASVFKFHEFQLRMDSFYAYYLQNFLKDEETFNEIANKLHQKILNNLVYQWLDQIPLAIWDKELTFFARLHTIAYQIDDINQRDRVYELIDLVAFFNTNKGSPNKKEEFIYRWLETNFNLSRDEIKKQGSDILEITIAIISETIRSESILYFQNLIKNELVRLHNLNESFSPFVYRGYDEGMTREKRVKLMRRDIDFNSNERGLSVNLGGEQPTSHSVNFTVTNLTTHDQLSDHTGGQETIPYHTGFAGDNISFTELLTCAAYYASHEGCISIASNTVSVDLDLYLMDIRNQRIYEQFNIKRDLREKVIKNLGVESYVCNFQIQRITELEEYNAPPYIRYEITDPILSEDLKRGLLPLSVARDEQGFYQIPFFLINACVNILAGEPKRFFFEVAPDQKTAVLRLIEQVDGVETVLFSTDNEFDNPQYRDKIANQSIYNYVFSYQSQFDLTYGERLNFIEYVLMAQRRFGEHSPVEAEQERTKEVKRVQKYNRGVLGRHLLFSPHSSDSNGEKEDTQSEKHREEESAQLPSRNKSPSSQ
ncbi:hypothetical protein [Legionella drozanskii]|uniref:Ankyrin repeat protein n=1 Tax=Legionella drozanskii LLAP-1 TaxID=1212489 RepID=A0A0W0SQZ1_9GAMM|nr:hypothetical protein [Legionella drozanskii]KTC85645.1 hypothetical protein Ldro_1970 [Legionella drozanskii LLAP-1]